MRQQALTFLLSDEWLLKIGLKVLDSVDSRKRREDFVNGLLEQCCKDGLLSGKLVSMVRTVEKEERIETGDEEVFYKYLQQPPFPPTWTRSISDSAS